MEEKHIKEYSTLFTGLIVLFPVAACLFYALNMPVSYDEAWTFLNFTHKGFMASLSTYPAPNNHVFFSVLTNVSYLLPTENNLIKIRLISIIAYFITLFILFDSMKKWFNLKFALLVVAIAPMLFFNLYYSYMARGYGLINLFYLLAFQASINCIKNDARIKSWILFSLYSILGFYTIPTFIYVFLILNVFILYQKKALLRNQIVAVTIVILTVFLLYLPIISHEGVKAIVANKFVLPKTFYSTFRSFPRFSLKCIDDISGIKWYFVLPFCCYSVYYIIFIKKNKPLFSLILLLLTTIFAVLLIQRVIPFTRIFNFLSFGLVVFILFPFFELIRKMKLKHVFLLAFCFQLLLLFNFNKKVIEYEERDLALNITASQIIPNILGDYNYLVNKSLLASNLEFELIAKGFKKYKITDYATNKHLNADHILDINYIIIDKNSDCTKFRKPIYKTAYYNIYMSKQ